MPRKPIEQIFCPVGWGFWQCLTAYICHMGRGIFAVLTSVNVNSPICPGGRWGLCASQFQPRASPAPPPPPGQTPGHLKSFFQMPGPAGNFCWQMPPPPPVPSLVVKCPALQSIRSIYKIIICHILINITGSAQ